MPRKVDPSEKIQAIRMMFDGYSQRSISSITGLSRPYLRKVSKSAGHQFPRNGIELKGVLCACKHCDRYFYRPFSKVTRAENNYCSELCKNWDVRGQNHPNWKDGESARSFSTWITNQSGYKAWREEVLERAGRRCQISGRDYDLDCHHLVAKAERNDLALDPENGLVLNKEVHTRLHQLISQKMSAEEAMSKVIEEFRQKE